MPQDGPVPHLNRVEQVIETIFTCRTVVKYDLQLGEEHKNRLLKDIDSALDVLRAQIILPSIPVSEDELVPPYTPNKISLVSYSSGELREKREKRVPDARDTSSSANSRNTQPSGENDSSLKHDDANAAGAQMLQALYRMYHTYVDSQQGPNITTFVARFNEVMATIGDIQQSFIQPQRYGSYAEVAHQPHQSYQSGGREEPFEQLRTFVADLYYIFMDFVRVLSETLQQNNVHLDTEKLFSMQAETHSSQFVGARIDGIYQLYESYHHYVALKEDMLHRITAATAFLEFLKQRVNMPAHKLNDVHMQIDKVIALLGEMDQLLGEYEKMLSLLLFRGH
ncbi:hypothetical protein ccbrp13_35460 [Ktedonobacteria bacterium brp13]|nr:hypothetical protein ccbrp13_35460 [Ktedonobacteria bacterium brp13]